MRIISGKYKGKKLDGFDIDGTRPTMDRVKESMFGTIQNYIKDSICLDLFAGSGSLGIEALSNGAKNCYFVDSGTVAFKVLCQNLKQIEEEKNLYNMDYEKALDKFRKENIKFDIIFIDPPYALNLITPSLKKIKEYNLLKKDGIIVCEYEHEEIKTDFVCIKDKKYGTTHVSIYK